MTVQPVPAPPRPLVPGEPAPLFVVASDVNPAFDFSTVTGPWTLLLFFGSLSTPLGAAPHDKVRARRALFNDADAMFFGVSIDPADKAERGLRNAPPGLRYFWDYDAAVSRRYGAAFEGAFRPLAVLLDRAGRIVTSAPASRIDAVLDMLERHLEADRLAEGEMFAPVLAVPRVFEPELCAELIDYYARIGGAPSGYMTEKDGMTVGVTDGSRKRRRDVYIDDESLRTELRNRLERRLAPMIRRAFGWAPTRIERYLIGCYSGEDQGLFFPHRDNTTAGTAHRKFAVTINLNAEDYEGGELRFPEFGRRTYKPPTGGAVVFGCGLMHEATAVTAGVRYAFLPFFYDEEGARLRAANLHKIARADPAVEPASAG